MLSNNISYNEKGELLFAGQSVAALAETYGTPLYLMDENRIRENCRTYLRAFGDHLPGKPSSASKAASFLRIYQIMAEEGMDADVVSGGELYTAKKAGFPMEHILFHGNNKTDEEIALGLTYGVGLFVVDGEDELRALSKQAQAMGKVQKVLLRLTPGIDPHTYEAVSTGKVDSKFGTAIETGQAMPFIRLALSLPGIELAGFHCHVGSQVFGEDVYQRTCDVMIPFMAQVREELGYTAKIFDIGGGYGVPYVETDGQVDIYARFGEVADHLKGLCREDNFPLPYFMMEPGRSIVADAGMTVYRVGSVKRIPGYKNYVSVDGGMTDNPRYALYGAKYTVLPAKRGQGDGSPVTENENRDVTGEPSPCHIYDLVGKCCESGDIVQPDVCLPDNIARGDLVCVCTTGAYNYSMASNYNRVPRPALVLLRDDTAFVAVRRETLEDLVGLDEKMT